MSNSITVPFLLTPGPAGPGFLSTVADAVPAGNPTQIIAGTFVGADCRTGPVVLTAPVAPTDGAMFGVADLYGASVANPITINASGVGVTIANPLGPTGSLYGASASMAQSGAQVQVWRYHASTQQWRFASSSASPGAITLTLANGTNSNVPTNGSALQVIGGPTAAFALGSVLPPAPLLSGQPVTFEYVGGQAWSLIHQDPAATGGSLTFAIVGQSVAGSQVEVFGKVTAHCYGTTLVVDPGAHYKRDYDIREFGASTVAADNSAAIQAAIDAAALVAGTVIVPAGVYRHSSTLIRPSGVWIVGMGFTFETSTAVTGSVLQMTGLGDQIQTNNPLNGSTVDGGGYKNVCFQRLDSMGGGLPFWAASTAHAVGDIVQPSTGLTTVVLRCTVAGTTGLVEPIGALCPGGDSSGNVGAPIYLKQTATLTTDVTIDLTITATGGAGVGTFTYQVNGGATSGTETIPAPTSNFPVPGTNYALVFPGSSYTVNTVYRTAYVRWGVTPGVTVTDGTAQWETVTAGVGIGITASTSVYIENVGVLNHLNGMAIDQGELIHINGACQFGNCPVGLWLVQSTAYNTAAPKYNGGFGNRISVMGSPQFNGGAGIIDDGGLDHSFNGCNFNCAYPALILSGVVGGTVDGGEFEGANVAVARLNAQKAFLKLRDQSFYDRFTSIGQSTITLRGGASFSGTTGVALVDATSISGSATCTGLQILDITPRVNNTAGAVVGSQYLAGAIWTAPNPTGHPPFDAGLGGLGGCAIILSSDGSMLTYGGVFIGALGGQGQVPGATLHVTGSHAFGSIPWNAYNAIANGLNSNVGRTYQYSSLRIVTGYAITAAFSIDGIVAPVDSTGALVDGYELDVTNETGEALTWINKTASVSSANNQIWTTTNANVTLTPATGGFTRSRLRYCKALSCWQLLA